MKTQVANPTLADVLDRQTAVGELGHAEGDRIRCVACGHRCLIGEGKRGICKVRFVEDGQLRVPFGYVAGLQCDPVEKKPFFHVYPSSDALTFGMMGCDLHCSYCFRGSTRVPTTRGVETLESLFSKASRVVTRHDGEIATVDGLSVYTHTGKPHPVRAVFRHPYSGEIRKIVPAYCPPIECTPDHRFLAIPRPKHGRPPQKPSFVKAQDLSRNHCLVIPKQFPSREVTIDVPEWVAPMATTCRMKRRWPVEFLRDVLSLHAEGLATATIARRVGVPRHRAGAVLTKVKAGQTSPEDLLRYEGLVLVEGNHVRLFNEHSPGIPRNVVLDERLAELLGYYCAEGCVWRDTKRRANSGMLTFSFGRHEEHLAERVVELLTELFGVAPAIARRETTCAVVSYKASLAHLLEALCGTDAGSKRVPPPLFEASAAVVNAFLKAYVAGDGSVAESGMVETATVSADLAHGVAWLALKSGAVPSLRVYKDSGGGNFDGRKVHRSEEQFRVRWYPKNAQRRCWEDDESFYIPIRAVECYSFSGYVFNMDVETDHTYLPNFVAASNCQNWVSSQALRDPEAAVPVRPVTAEDLIDVARRERARLVVSSYNEPLITAEWAVAVFREAKAAGLACAFVSNGNATPEALDYLQPWILAYKVDLKSFDDHHYRTLGGTLGQITDTIRMVHARGIWLEVVTLVIPGFNDSEAELRQAARFLASVSPDVPWHVTAFHKDYKMTGPDPTPVETLVRACEIGTEEGLRYVYAGNLPGRVGPWEDTRCPTCRATLIERYGYLIRSYRLTPDGRCPHCATAIPGVWPGSADEVRTGTDLAAYRRRLPRPVATAAVHRPAEGRQPLPLVNSPGEPPSGGTTEMTPSSPPAPAAARPDLTDEQRQQLVAATTELLRAVVAGRQAVFPGDALASVGDLVVSGAFVSLKRGGHLRSCCGMLGRPVPLRAALQEAAARTVWEDARFPPVSPTEVGHLDLEVWLLHSPEPMRARGEERAAAVTVGRHGLQVVRGDARGLLLPGVAVDNDWDSLRFLEQVCVKAGLHPSSWKDAATALVTFEAEVLTGQLARDGAEAARPAGVVGPEQLAAYVEFCRQNVAALLVGATPNCYLLGAADGTVSGAVLTLKPQGAAEGLHFSQVSLRPGVPLQATLFALSQAAAQALAAQRVPADALGQVQVGLTVLHDPALHGTVADPHLAGLDPQHRAALVIERAKTALVFDPARTPEQLVAEAATQARVSQPAAAPVFSLEALSTVAPVVVSTAPQPVRGPAVRPPAVAGTFYPADPAKLTEMVDALLAVGDGTPEPWPAALVPHAGLVYSGQVAAKVLKRIKLPRTVIVLGPKHTPLGMDWAVAPHQTWALPGGSVESDFVLARRLAQAIPGLEMDAAAHQREHGVEVELPLIARLAPATRVVGIAVGGGDLEACRRFAQGLAEVLRGRDDRPLLLISSDMNHFATDAENRRLDELALQALERLDPAGLYETVTRNHISMCGVLPAVIVLETLRLLGGLSRAERVGYATSADVTGDASRVVGYAGMLFD